MYIPTLAGTIDRRLLVNYRVDPATLQRLLPAPFRPKLIHGMGVAGICLIRLTQLRPRAFAVPLGLASENAAHRIAVVWDEDGHTHEGVYIPRRDTSSRLTALVGGRLFPGVHQHARFQVTESPQSYAIELESDDGHTHVEVEARVAPHLPQRSIFTSLDEASAFFAAGAVGYSVTNRPGRLDGIELRCQRWQMQPLEVLSAQSSFFDDRNRFPAGSAELDCALLMRAIPHEWYVREPFSTEPFPAPERTDMETTTARARRSA